MAGACRPVFLLFNRPHEEITMKHEYTHRVFGDGSIDVYDKGTRINHMPAHMAQLLSVPKKFALATYLGQPCPQVGAA